MSIKRFVAADMRRAMELVKQEMGPDAIILSSNRIKEGVEIVTSDDANYQSVADPRSLPSAFSQSATSPVPKGQSFDRHLDSALTQLNAQASSLGDRQEIPFDKFLGAESESLLDKFRKKQLKNQTSESESGLSAFEYYNSKAKHAVNIDTSSKESFSGNDFVTPFHLASMQYEPGNTNIHFDLDNKCFSSMKGGVEITEIIDEKIELNNVDNFLDEQFGQLRSEILEMRELLRQQLQQPIVTKHSSSAKNIESRAIKNKVLENKVSFIKSGEPLLKIITKRLKNLGLPESEIKQCLSKMDVSPLKKHNTKGEINALDKIWSSALADIAHRLTSGSSKDHKSSVAAKGTKKVSIFTGVSGAGKVDSIGKIATQHVLDMGSDNLVMISYERNGLNLHQDKKLDRLSQILGVQHFVVSNISDITSIINHVQKGVRVLINLPSITLNKQSFANELSGTITQLRSELKVITSNYNLIDIDTYMVVSANTPKVIVNRLFTADNMSVKSGFLKAIDNCIVTQLDQLESVTENTFGFLLGCLLSANLPVSHISNGANLPHYLQTAKGFQLVTTAVKLMKRSIQQKDTHLKNTLNANRLGVIHSNKKVGKEAGVIQSRANSTQTDSHKSQVAKQVSKTASSFATLQQVAAP